MLVDCKTENLGVAELFRARNNLHLSSQWNPQFSH